jgi:hypothetical protein
MRKGCSSLWAALVVFNGLAAFGAVSGPVDLLPVIADEMEKYLDKIRTWKGSAEHQYYTLVEFEGITFEEDNIDQILFLVDRQNNYARSSLDRVSANSGEKSPFPLRVEAVSINQTVFWMLPFQIQQEAPVRTLVIEAEEEQKAREIGNILFNPYQILQRLASELQKLSLFRYEQLIKTGDLSGQFKISCEKNLITIYRSLESSLKYRGLEFGLSEEKWILDQSKGYGIVELQQTNSLQKEIWHITYEMFQDIPLPSEITYSYESSIPTKRVKRSQVKIKTEMLNESVPENERELLFAKMGLRKGDFIVDQTKGSVRYQWDPNSVESK